MSNALIGSILHLLQMGVFIHFEAVVFIASCIFLFAYLFKRSGR